MSLTQDGAIEGVKYFFKADFEKLLDPIVWYRAVEQSFFSLAVCFGSLVMYSSYNNFSNNVNRDAIIISVLDTFTSLLAGSVIFAVLGTMAHKMNKEIKDVIKSGLISLSKGNKSILIIHYQVVLVWPSLHIQKD